MLEKMEVCAWELTRSRLSWRVGTHVVIIIIGEVSHLILSSVRNNLCLSSHLQRTRVEALQMSGGGSQSLTTCHPLDCSN